MNILLADTLPDDFRAELTALGHHCTDAPELDAAGLPARLAGHEVLIVRSTVVTAEALRAGEDLRLVIRAGSGTNTIDVAAAGERGIAVCNVPGRNAIAVAELAFGLLLSLDRHIPEAVTELRAGRWDKNRFAVARGIKGRRIGIVGLGRIGLAFAERAVAFGASVYTLAKAGRDAETLSRARAIGMRYVDGLPELARTCDVLSLHLPSNAGTRQLVDAALLAELPQGAIVLNTARGELIDEPALLAALDGKGLRAGLDVFADEPGSSTGAIHSRLAAHPNVHGTHHIGASTEQAQQAVAEEVLHILADFTEGRLRHCVNREAIGLALSSGGAP
ncbi:NAD(P)-dependent oxidoreductase [Sciscionella marina]|uniref:NAD(P)-dependent oxidoreductase n=1 Tax=Sciscionella marina TaxID=508770 RepID=UPI00037634D4|nr:NAD(P)-dependent oxidoreductase [Sciscionella marina]